MFDWWVAEGTYFVARLLRRIGRSALLMPRAFAVLADRVQAWGNPAWKRYCDAKRALRRL